MSHKYVDFSSDDDFGSSAKKKAFKRRSIGGPIYNREYFMNEIIGYTDEDLFLSLKRYNFDCGPVSGSTRKVYQKKLAEKMVEGPPPPPPKTGRRSMGPTFRSLPTRPRDLEDDFISGSSGSDIEGDEVDSIIPRKPVPANLGRDRQKPSDSNHKGSGTYAKKHPPRIEPPPESLLPTIQLRRLDREDRATPPPPPEEDASKHPHKIQPMHREKVKPKPKPHTSKEGSHKEDVSIWVQVIILLICLLVTIFFLKYIDSTETLPKAPDLTDTPPITPDILDQFQPEPPQNQTDTPPITPDILEQFQPEPPQNQTDTPSKESTSALDDVEPPSPKENKGRSPPIDPITANNTPSNQSPDDTPPANLQSVNVNKETDRAANPPKDSVKGKNKAKKKKSKGAAS